MQKYKYCAGAQERRRGPTPQQKKKKKGTRFTDCFSTAFEQKYKYWHTAPNIYIYTCVFVCVCVCGGGGGQDIHLSSGMHSAAIPEALTFEPTEEQVLTWLALLVQK